MKEPKLSEKDLLLMANTIRQDIVKMLVEAKSGHPGGSLGLTDIFTILYFKVMNHNPKKPDWADRDRFVLSNGHVCPVLYAALANSGYFPKSELSTFRKVNSKLQGHPHRGTVPGIENSSGPLGQGISQAVGMAIVSKREKQSWKVYSMIGDGEMNEGMVWEALMLASKYSLDNLVMFIDRNNIQIDGNSDDVLPLEPLGEKLRAFGFDTVEIDGHDMKAIYDAVIACESKPGKPHAIIAKTIPGKGISLMENKFEWHGKAPNKEQGDQALKELNIERETIQKGAD
ncbi:transketolase [Candidatus Micrarchaeota archaeon]|nr:transketolase [Candidatus Micrarchaeota archaeon]